MRDFDDNEFPLAYLITLRTYGTWLHGDERGSMDRKHNVYGTSKIKPNPVLHKSDTKQLRHPPVTLNARQRPVVEQAIREVCDHRPYVLRGINVRTNHVHAVGSAWQYNLSVEGKRRRESGRVCALGLGDDLFRLDDDE